MAIKQNLADLYGSGKQVKALEVALRRSRRGKNRELTPSDRMDLINDLLGGHGVEAIRSDNWFNGYWGDVCATYINFGDTYDATIICQRTGRSEYECRLFISSWGDFVERNSKKLQLI